MSQNEDKNLTDHDYDGIREFDNLLPNWWLMIFFGTIIFSFIYVLHYTVGGGQTQAQELAKGMEALPQAAEKIWTESELQGKVDSPEMLKMGMTVFSTKCSACHGVEGQGVIGPNLTDHYWIHGTGDRKGIIQVVKKGVLEKGMPAWEGLLSDEEVLSVVGYVYSLRNTNPAQPKEPQGEEYKN
jgi:cytochrome c oxidase cbb3-type subunit III